jgi:hypothetical protein
LPGTYTCRPSGAPGRNLTAAERRDAAAAEERAAEEAAAKAELKRKLRHWVPVSVK